MNARLALLAVPLALLAACSDDDPTIYTLSTGTYDVSGADTPNATPGDECLLLSTYQAADKQIAIDVTGTMATFNLAMDDVAASWPKATINGNSIEQPVEADYTANLGTCQVRIRRTVTGDLTANDQAALLLHAYITVVVDTTDCDNRPQYRGDGCQSDIHFIANKVVAQ